MTNGLSDQYRLRRRTAIEKLVDQGLKKIFVQEEELLGSYLAEDIINEDSGEVLFESGDQLDEESLKSLKEIKPEQIKVLIVDNNNAGPWILNTFASDKNTSREEALVDIYRVMRPGEPPAYETAEALFNSLFFDNDRYFNSVTLVSITSLNSSCGL